MTNIGRKITAAPDREYYMLVSGGLPAYTTDAEGEKFWPLAETDADAQRLATWMGLPGDAQPVKIGGESLDRHIALAIAAGCENIACVFGWAEPCNRIACVCGWAAEACENIACVCDCADGDPLWVAEWLDRVPLQDMYEGREESAFAEISLALQQRDG